MASSLPEPQVGEKPPLRQHNEGIAEKPGVPSWHEEVKPAEQPWSQEEQPPPYSLHEPQPQKSPWQHPGPIDAWQQPGPSAPYQPSWQQQTPTAPLEPPHQGPEQPASMSTWQQNPKPWGPQPQSQQPKPWGYHQPSKEHPSWQQQHGHHWHQETRQPFPHYQQPLSPTPLQPPQQPKIMTTELHQPGAASQQVTDSASRQTEYPRTVIDGTGQYRSKQAFIIGLILLPLAFTAFLTAVISNSKLGLFAVAPEVLTLLAGIFNVIAGKKPTNCTINTTQKLSAFGTFLMLCLTMFYIFLTLTLSTSVMIILLVFSILQIPLLVWSYVLGRMYNQSLRIFVQG